MECFEARGKICVIYMCIKKIEEVRKDLKLKSKSELLQEINEEDRKPEPFIIYLSGRRGYRYR